MALANNAATDLLKDHLPMKPDLERTLKLKQVAERLMREGDMERYLHALRLLLAQRMRNAVLA